MPTHLNFLTIDNSYGDMPAEVPDEVIPHILKARYDMPTAPGGLGDILLMSITIGHIRRKIDYRKFIMATRLIRQATFCA